MDENEDKITADLNMVIRMVSSTFLHSYSFFLRREETPASSRTRATLTRRLLLPSSRTAGQFPDPAKAISDLKKFAEANEDRLYKILKSAMDPQTELKTLVKLNVSSSSLLSWPRFVPLDSLLPLLRTSSGRVHQTLPS